MFGQAFAIALCCAGLSAQQITPAQSHSLARGVRLPEFRLATLAYNSRSATDFGPYSATSLSAIRLRFNMNAVLLPLDRAGADSAEYAAELAKLVRRANDLELLVVIPGELPRYLAGNPGVVSDAELELARGWEPDFDDPAACAKLPSDPAELSRRVREQLD